MNRDHNIIHSQGLPGSKKKVMRVCSACGFKDSSPIPPVMCPACHFQEDSPLVSARPPGNRRERRAHAAKMRLQMRRTQKQILRESGGKYEAS